VKAKYQAILWDNDGVLVDTERLYFKASQQALAKVGIDLTRQQFHAISLTRGESVFTLVRQLGLPNERVEELREFRNQQYSKLILADTDLLIEGVPGVLALLEPSYRMGIVSNSLRRHFQDIHTKTEILHNFEFILVAEDYEGSKPEPAPYLAGLEKLGLATEQCLVIEDAGRGLQAAVSAGIDCVVIPHELTRDTDFGKAVAVLTELRQLPEWLEEH